MEKRLDIARAARLAGVTPEEIRRQVARGGLPSADGKIEVEDLLRLYPEVHLRGAQMVEIVGQIKDDAIAKGLLKRRSPTLAELKEELRKARNEADFYRVELDRQRQLLLDLRGMLLEVKHRGGESPGARLDAVIAWLSQKLKASR